MKTLDAYPLDTKLVRKGAFTEALQDWDTYHQAFVELTLKHVGGGGVGPFGSRGLLWWTREGRSGGGGTAPWRLRSPFYNAQELG